MISETKLDDSFPDGQFLTENYHAPFRFDRNEYRGEIILYVPEGNLLKYFVMIFLLQRVFLSQLICTKEVAF